MFCFFFALQTAALTFISSSNTQSILCSFHSQVQIEQSDKVTASANLSTTCMFYIGCLYFIFCARLRMHVVLADGESVNGTSR